MKNSEKQKIKDGLEKKKKKLVISSVSLKYLDVNSWGFKKLENKEQRKRFDNFIKKVNKNEFNWETNKRTSNKNDIFKNDVIAGEQIEHYSIGKEFRIHGFFYGKRFKLFRIDPNHEFND